MPTRAVNSPRRGITRTLALLYITTLTACATTGPPPIGSGAWHELRTAEIEHAFNFGEITKADYLSLKNQTDDIHVTYRARMQPARTSTSIIGGSGFIR